MTLLVFLGGSSLLEGVGVVSLGPKILNDFKTDLFQAYPLIVIPSIPFLTYQVLAFAGTRRSTKFEYSFNFRSSFHYFTELFVVTTGKVRRIVCDIRCDLADVEGIVDKRKSTVR